MLKRIIIVCILITSNLGIVAAKTTDDLQNNMQQYSTSLIKPNISSNNNIMSALPTTPISYSWVCQEVIEDNYFSALQPASIKIGLKQKGQKDSDVTWHSCDEGADLATYNGDQLMLRTDTQFQLIQLNWRFQDSQDACPGSPEFLSWLSSKVRIPSATDPRDDGLIGENALWSYYIQYLNRNVDDTIVYGNESLGVIYEMWDMDEYGNGPLPENLCNFSYIETKGLLVRQVAGQTISINNMLHSNDHGNIKNIDYNILFANNCTIRSKFCYTYYKKNVLTGLIEEKVLCGPWAYCCSNAPYTMSSTYNQPSSETCKLSFLGYIPARIRLSNIRSDHSDACNAESKYNDCNKNTVDSDGLCSDNGVYYPSRYYYPRFADGTNCGSGFSTGVYCKFNKDNIVSGNLLDKHIGSVTYKYYNYTYNSDNNEPVDLPAPPCKDSEVIVVCKNSSQMERPDEMTLSYSGDSGSCSSTTKSEARKIPEMFKFNYSANLTATPAYNDFSNYVVYISAKKYRELFMGSTASLSNPNRIYSGIPNDNNDLKAESFNQSSNFKTVHIVRNGISAWFSCEKKEGYGFTDIEKASYAKVGYYGWLGADGLQYPRFKTGVKKGKDKNGNDLWDPIGRQDRYTRQGINAPWGRYRLEYPCFLLTRNGVSDLYIPLKDIATIFGSVWALNFWDKDEEGRPAYEAMMNPQMIEGGREVMAIYDYRIAPNSADHYYFIRNSVPVNFGSPKIKQLYAHYMAGKMYGRKDANPCILKYQANCGPYGYHGGYSLAYNLYLSSGSYLAIYGTNTDHADKSSDKTPYTIIVNPRGGLPRIMGYLEHYESKYCGGNTLGWSDFLSLRTPTINRHFAGSVNMSTHMFGGTADFENEGPVHLGTSNGVIGSYEGNKVMPYTNKPFHLGVSMFIESPPNYTKYEAKSYDFGERWRPYDSRYNPSPPENKYPTVTVGESAMRTVNLYKYHPFLRPCETNNQCTPTPMPLWGTRSSIGSCPGSLYFIESMPQDWTIEERRVWLHAETGNEMNNFYSDYPPVE